MAKPNAESSRPVFLPTANAETSSKVRQQYERSNCSGTEEEPSRPKTGLTSTQRKQLRPTPSKLPADLPACSESKRMGQYEHHFPNEITDSDLSAAHSAYSLNLRRQHKEAVHTRTNLELERVAKGALGSSKPRLRPPPSPIVSQIPFSQPPPPMHHQKSRPLKRNQRDFPKGSSHEELYRMNSTNAYAKSVTRGEELSPVSNVTTCHPPQQPQPDPFPSVHEKDCPRVGSPVPYRTSYAIPALDVEPDTVCMEGWNGLPTPEKLAHYLSDTSEILPQCGKWGRQEDDNSNMNHVIDREGSECPQVHLSMLDGTPPYGKSPEPHFGPGSKHMSYKEVPTPQWYDDQEEWDRGASHSDDVELYDLALPTEQAPPSRLRSFLAAHLMVEHSRGDRPLLEEDDTSNFWHCER